MNFKTSIFIIAISFSASSYATPLAISGGGTNATTQLNAINNLIYNVVPSSPDTCSQAAGVGALTSFIAAPYPQICGNNTAFGDISLNKNQSGFDNNGFGNNTLNQNIDGTGNDAFGVGTLERGTHLNENTAYGDNALNFCGYTGGVCSTNIGIGDWVGSNGGVNGDGMSYNILIGNGALQDKFRGGNNNIWIANSDIAAIGTINNILDIGDIIWGTGLTTSSARIGINNQSPRSSFDVGSETDAIVLPIGTSAQRPSSPVTGMIRYNSTLNAVEAYISSAWVTSIGGSTGSGVSSFNGDGILYSNSASIGTVNLTPQVQTARTLFGNPSSSSSTPVSTSSPIVSGTMTALSYRSSGSTPTVSGCGAILNQSSSTSGDITTSGTTNCNLTISGLPTAVHNWVCDVHNVAHVGNRVDMNGGSSTSAVFQGTIVSGDELRFNCEQY